jgi:eukaryotic-like serine/threonine-protein kinase
MVGEQVLQYRILRQLGSGGMGVVYEAEDIRLGRHVAVKFLPQSLGVSTEAIDRFEREARIASSLNHPNICTIHDLGVYEGRQFIVMELLEGDSLRGRIHGQPLPLELILDVSGQIADALDAAHAKGIIHRDIKPANIFITKRGQAKLVDFGIAKLGGDRHEHDATAETKVAGDSLTVPGMAVGSINYMSPEQARGEDVDGRTDLFSLGLVLYEMATGRQAFAGQTTAVVFDGILNRQPAEPRTMNPDVPEGLQRVIMRSLEKDRRMRFQTAADMLAELARIRRDATGATAGVPIGTASVAASLPSTMTTPAIATAGVAAAAPTSGRSRWLLLGAAVLVLTGIGGYFAWRSARPPVLSARDTVLIADFANSTGDPVFDDALKQAVAVQLQQTPFVTLLADLRVQRTMRLMQRPPDEPVIGAVAREVCVRTGAKATIEGSIAPLGSAYVINLSANNCQSGEPLAQQQAQAASKEDVLNQLGVAVTKLREHLGESLTSIQKYDVPVTDATTKSLEALRAYGQGLRARSTKGDAASVPFFKQAIERDPTFALAYAKLGVVLGNQGQSDDAKENALKAYELRDRVSEYERLYINWNYASRVQQDQKAVKEALELLIAAYPNDYAARNNLGVYYNGRGEFDDALKEYKAASEIAPDEPSPISNAAYVAMFLGRLDEAYGLVDRALALRPDGALAITRWASAVMEHDPRAATFEQVAAKLASEDQMLSSRASLALWHGQIKKYDELLATLRAKAVAANNTDGALSLDIGQHITRAAYLGGPHLQALVALIPKVPSVGTQAQMAALASMLGQLAAVRPMLPQFQKAGENNQPVRIAATVVQAYAKAADGQPKEADAMLVGAMAEQPRSQDLQYPLGQIREGAGDIDGAIIAYQTVIKARAFLGANSVVAASRLAVARLYLKKGDTANAVKELDTLLVQWKDADTEFGMVKEAREARARIKG